MHAVKCVAPVVLLHFPMGQTWQVVEDGSSEYVAAEQIVHEETSPCPKLPRGQEMQELLLENFPAGQETQGSEELN
jgi:hypothetical protein